MCVFGEIVTFVLFDTAKVFSFAFFFKTKEGGKNTPENKTLRNLAIRSFTIKSTAPRLNLNFLSSVSIELSAGWPSSLSKDCISVLLMSSPFFLLSSWIDLSSLLNMLLLILNMNILWCRIISCSSCWNLVVDAGRLLRHVSAHAAHLWFPLNVSLC